MFSNGALTGIVYSAIAGMATSIGALPFLFFKKGVSRKMFDISYVYAVMMDVPTLGLVITL
ncbi:MAG: hypothetical protein U9O65_06060 [Thermotogota bacterium]|nr:hypothetical protein [Thermotogota bacterium]